MGQRVADRPTVRQFATQVVIAEPRDQFSQALELLSIPGDMIRYRIQARLL
jgi:hypothetical protein